MSRQVLLACGLVVALGSIPRPAGAGAITGTLSVPGSGAAMSAASSRPSARAKRRINPATEAVVYLAAIPPKLEKKLARKTVTAQIAQNRRAFVPRVLVIPAGTTVEFQNQDRVFHNAFSVSPAKRFDLGKYAPGTRRRVTFERAGAVQMFCDIDPQETGTVFVTPNHAYVRPDSLGAFKLPKLPAGDYTLKVWHPRFGALSREVRMPKRGDVALALRL